MDPQTLIDKSASQHSHLCPRQILGVRLGLLGMKALGYNEPPAQKRLQVIVESDGCFADGVIAATECTVGHRSLRVEDYGKTAATFVDTITEQAVRVAPKLDVRQQASLYVPDEPRRYFAQMQAYQFMPDDVMFTVTPVTLKTPVKDIISRLAVRINCNQCGEEIINERQVYRHGLSLCRACAGEGYYQPTLAITPVDCAHTTDQWVQICCLK